MKLLKESIVLLTATATAYDDSVKTCWDIRLQNEDYFCFDAVDWPISQPVYYEQ
jgi:hypothetical protein